MTSASPGTPAPVTENRATPLAALSGASTPLDLHFRRNHYPYPETPADWKLELGGAVARPLELGGEELSSLAQEELPVVLECAGHRRHEFRPPAVGLDWHAGAVAEASWRGARLAALLGAAGVFEGAVEVVLHGRDGAGDESFARSISIAKAMEATTLVALAVEGGPIPHELGGPVRAVVPGHYAVDSVKWLRAVTVVTEPFGGRYQADDYRLFGVSGPREGEPLRELPVTSLVTAPVEGDAVPAGCVPVSGVAWGAEPVARVEVRAGSGAWVGAELGAPAGRYGFTPWRAELDLTAGTYAVSARATDVAGALQPEEPLWNERGYGNNSVHRVTLTMS